jgi:hypothetical protein
MAIIKVNGVKELADKLTRNLRIELNKIFSSNELRETVGQIIVNDIKKNADFGKPAPSTKKWRKTYEPHNATDPEYNRDKLNATFTGELLEDLQKNIKGYPTKLTFEIGHSDKKHSQYKSKDGKIGKKTPYKVISKHLINELGYDYFQLTETAKKLIIEEIKKEFFKVLSKSR